MELFEEIRRGYAAGETIKSLARKHGVHRRIVRQAIASAAPPDRKKTIRNQRDWDRSKNTSNACWTATGRRRANSGTRRTGCGFGCGKSIPSLPSGSRRVR